MSSIDNRIVNLKIENKGLQDGAKSSLDILGRLKEALRFDGAGKGLSDVQANINKSDFSPMAASIEKVNAGFAAMATIAITALSNITTKAIATGTEIANSLFVAPKTEGLAEYELKLGSIQTIMASTGEKLPTVNKYLEELNQYSDKTIYSFSDMTSNIGKFTNAGVGLKESVAALQGVANVAAISGANSEEASRAMYNFSQALSIGHVNLMDWKSIELANMGTVEFREQLIDSAVAMGTLSKESEGVWKALDGTEVTVDNFRNTLNAQWLTSEALVDSLGNYADETTDIGKRATEAATQVKTLSHLMDTLQEGQASGWAMTWEHLIGDYDEARALFTGLNDVIGGFLGRQADARNKMLADWKAAGGRDDLLEGFKNIFEAIVGLIKPIHDAFRNIFPPMTGEQLAKLTAGFLKFTEVLKMGAPIGQILGNVFSVVFAILKVGVDIVKGVASVFINLFAAIFGALSSGGEKSVLQFFADMTDGIGNAAEAFSKGDYIINFFERVNAVVSKVIPPIVDGIKLLVDAYKAYLKGDEAAKELFLEAAFEKFAAVINIVMDALGPVGDVIEDVLGKISAGAKSLKTFLDEMKVGALKPFSTALEWISGALDDLSDQFGKGLSFGKGLGKGVSVEADILRSRIETLAGWLKTGWDGIVKGLTAAKDAIGPILDWLGDRLSSFGEFIGNLGMKDTAQLVNTGVFIAAGVLVIRIFRKIKEVLDSFGDISESVADTFDQVTSSLKTMQTNVRANILIKIAVAVGLLAASLYLLSRIESEDLMKGLAGVALLLAGVVSTMGIVSKYKLGTNIAGMKAAAMLILIAGAILLLSIAVRSLSGMSWDELAKGLAGVAGLLVSLGIFSKLAEANTGGFTNAAGLILLAAAIGLLGFAVEKFGQMDQDVLIQGLATVGSLIVAFGTLSKVVNGVTGMVGAATGMLILSGALLAMYFVIKLYNKLDYGTFAKGMGMIAVAVLALGAAMRIFPEKGAIAGAAALVILAAAMLVMSGVLKIFATMNMGEMAKSLIMLAGSLGIIAIAMLIFSQPNMMTGTLALGVVVLALYALAGVLTVFAAFDIGDIAASLGMLAGIFVIIGLAGLIMGPVVPVLVALAIAIGLLGVAMLAAGAGMALFGIGFATLTAAGVAGVAVLVAAFEGIIALIPLFMEQVGLGLIALANVIAESGPELVSAMVTVVESITTALITTSPMVAAAGVAMLLEFIGALEEVFPEINAAGMRMIIGFLENVRANTGEITQIAIDILVSFMNTVEANIDTIVDAAVNLAVTFLDEVEKGGDEITDKAAQMVVKFITGIGDNMLLITGAAFNLVVEFMTELERQLDKNVPIITELAIDIGLAIPGGIITGIRNKFASSSVAKEIYNGASAGIHMAKVWLGIASPSKLTASIIGEPLAEGVGSGINQGQHFIDDAAVRMSSSTLKVMQSALDGAIFALKSDMDLTPTITPVIDLTRARKDASTLSALMPDLHFGAEVSLHQARALLEEKKETEDRTVENNEYIENNEYNYNQTINSPKAISSAETYRSTKNLISQTKKEL